MNCVHFIVNELQPVQLTLKGSTDTRCMWMDAEGILGSRRSRIPRATPWRIPFTGSVPTPGKSRDGKQGGGWPGLEQGMARGCLQWGPPPPARGHRRAGGWWVGPSGARLGPGGERSELLLGPGTPSFIWHLPATDGSHLCPSAAPEGGPDWLLHKALAELLGVFAPCPWVTQPDSDNSHPADEG